jgi:hypothetical protein
VNTNTSIKKPRFTDCRPHCTIEERRKQPIKLNRWHLPNTLHKKVVEEKLKTISAHDYKSFHWHYKQE